jgi:hypothetical protein
VLSYGHGFARFCYSAVSTTPIKDESGHDSTGPIPFGMIQPDWWTGVACHSGATYPDGLTQNDPSLNHESSLRRVEQRTHPPLSFLGHSRASR